MVNTYKLPSGKIIEIIQTAKEQTEDLIDSLLRGAIDEFEKSSSDGFKLTLTIEGDRAGEDATLTLQTKGQTSVEMKHKDTTKAEVIDWGPNLFDNAQEEATGGGEPEASSPRLLRAAPKLLPAPVVEVEAEIVEDGNDAPEEGAGD